MEIQVQIQYNIGNTLTVSNNVQTFARTYLSADIAAGVTTFNVDNTSEFTAPQLGLLSSIGSQSAEFVELSLILLPTVVTTSTTLFPHNRGEIFQIVNYDRIVVEKSATQNGSYTPFGTFTIQATQQDTLINDPTGLSTDWYKLQFTNSITGNSSNFSTPASAAALDPDSVGNMFNSIVTGFGISPNDSIITTEFLLNALNEARTLTTDTMANFKQSFLEKFEFPIQLAAGWNRIPLPLDYDYRFTNSKLLAVRYPRINGLAPYPLTYVDKREWNATAYSLKYSYTLGTATASTLDYNTLVDGPFIVGETVLDEVTQTQATIGDDNGTQLQLAIIPGTGTGIISTGDSLQGQLSGATAIAGAYVAGGTTLQVQDIGDFAPFPNNNAASTIFIATTAINQSIIEVSYTGIDIATNTFTGCTGIARNVPPGVQTFAFPTFTSATYYTVYENYQDGLGYIVFNRPIPNVMQGRNVYIDYYQKLVPVTDINTVLDEPFKYIYRFYIRYAIKYRRDNATSIDTDPDYKQFAQLLQEWINNHYIGQMQKIITR